MKSPDNEEWPHVCRIIWLSGGIIAVNEPGSKVDIEVGINGPVCYTFHLSSYRTLFRDLTTHGFSIVGATYIVDIDETRGIRPPEFRAWSRTNSWLVSNLHQQWREVAHAASQKDEMDLMDVASRIASVFAYSEMRLQNLAEAYSAQLAGKAKQGELEEFTRFTDLNSPRVYMAIHALFWELAVLRDTLSEFAAKFIFALDKVTSFRGLLSELRNRKCEEDLAVELLAAGEKKSGWIAEFTDYRNLFTHRAPMDQAAGTAYAVLEQMDVVGRKIPQICYPLPRDVQELSDRRVSGSLYKNMNEFIAGVVGRNAGRDVELDALRYLNNILEAMAALGGKMIRRSPIPPQMIHLTEADIVGPVKIVNR